MSNGEHKVAANIGVDNMEKVLRLKVEQNHIVKECLLNTKDYINGLLKNLYDI